MLEMQLLFAQAEASSVDVQSFWDLLVKGGVMMIPIGICSLIALAVFVERVFMLRRPTILPPTLVPSLDQAMQKSRDTKPAEALCTKDGSPLAKLLFKVLRHRQDSIEVIERHVEQAGQREILNMRKHLRVLSVTASVTPLLGLLGTIMGMIRAFQTVATSAEALGKTEMLATGIYEAMITTAAGLSVAIPVLIGYHFLVGRIERLVADLDYEVDNFVERHVRGRPTDAEAAAAATAEPVTDGDVSATPAVAS